MRSLKAFALSIALLAALLPLMLPRSVESQSTIARHKGEAQSVTTNFNNLNSIQQQQVLTFLSSL